MKQIKLILISFLSIFLFGQHNVTYAMKREYQTRSTTRRNNTQINDAYHALNKKHTLKKTKRVLTKKNNNIDVLTPDESDSDVDVFTLDNTSEKSSQSLNISNLSSHNLYLESEYTNPIHDSLFLDFHNDVAWIETL